MFKVERIEKKQAAELVRSQLKQFPHCDSRVLHAPGECEFCDRHPDWQALRLAWGIAFTGWEPEGEDLPDPATKRRPLDKVHAWSGNQPKLEALPCLSN